MSHVFTSLRHPLERILEAEYFLGQLAKSNGLEFQFQLNAFLSASRSVTFVLQKSLNNTAGFKDWHGPQQESMKADPSMRFFLELRNISQKEGPVSYVGGARIDGGWTYRFAGSREAVPKELLGRDICDCCAEQIVKLAKMLLSYSRCFPFDACPARAFTEEGMAALGYSFTDVEDALGLPRGYTQVANIPVPEKLRILSREIEPLDIVELERITAGDFRSNGVALEIYRSSGGDLVDDVAAMIEARHGGTTHPRSIFLESIMRRIQDIESGESDR
jgi:hypothetical protein